MAGKQAAHICARGQDKKSTQQAGYRARRWVVKWARSWLNQFRACSSARQKRWPITWPSCISLAASSPGAQQAYWDRLQAGGHCEAEYLSAYLLDPVR